MFDDDHEEIDVQKNLEIVTKGRPKKPSLKQLAKVALPGSTYRMKSKADIMQERIEKMFAIRRTQMLDSRLRNTPLSQAMKWAIMGEEHALRHEIKSGFDINSRDPFNGRTVLHEACGSGHYPIVRMLILEFGVDVNIPTIIGHSTALHIASERGFRQIVSILLGHGADPFLVDEQGCTALHVATKFAVAKAILKSSKADPTLRNHKGQTPLEQYLSAVSSDDQDHAMIDYMRQQEDERMVEIAREKIQLLKFEKNEQLKIAAMITDANTEPSRTVDKNRIMKIYSGKS